LAEAKWKKVSWRRGLKGPLSARFAALRVRIADGPPQRILDKGQQHLPGEEAWLIGEWRSSGERKYYLSNLRDPPVSTADHFRRGRLGAAFRDQRFASVATCLLSQSASTMLGLKSSAFHSLSSA
jgi:hypothetical protein